MTTPALLFALLQAPAAVDSLNDRAQQLAVAGRSEEAAEIWRKILRQSPGYFPAAFNLGFFHYSRQQYKEAAPYLEKAVRLNPGDFNSRFLSGQVKSALGQGDAALREWRAALQLQPSHTRLMGIMVVEYSKGGYYRDAANLAKRALALSADLNTYFLAIKACQDAEDPEGPAIALRALQKFPDSARANFEHAWYLQRSGRASESVSFLKKAMALDPAYEEPFFFYGGILLDEGRTEEAIEPLQTAVRNRPDYTGASVALGRALMELERYDEAVRVLEEAARLAPNHPQPPLMLSRLYFRLGEETKARQARDLSLRLRREHGELMEVPQSRPFRP